MAIYHFSAQMIKRSDGRSAVAAAAYRAAENLTDARTGLTHDFTAKKGVDFSAVLLPANAPAEYADRGTLWGAVEKVERRKDAQVAREINVALPVELSHDDKIALAREFVQAVFVDAGMVADLCLHDLNSPNPHAHIMLSTRHVSPDGFGKKNTAWNDRDTLKKWREQWQEHANAALEKAGFDARIDHRTLLEQGITDRAPQVHLGPARHAMKRRGVTLDSVPLQLERQRLRRAAQDAAAAKVAEAEAQARVDFLSAQLDDIQAQRRENHEQRIDAIRAAIAAAEQREQSIRERIDAVTADTARGEKIVRQQREKITIAERHEQDARERISAVTADAATAERHEQDVRERIDEATAAIERARAIAATVGRTVSRALGAVTGSISGWRERRAEQRRTADAIAAITTEIEQITDAITDAQRQHRSATDADHSIRGRIQSTAARIDDARERISRAKPLAATPDQRRAIERIARSIRTRDPHVIPTPEQCHSRAVAEYDQLHAPAQPAPLRRPTPTHTHAPTQYDTPKG